MAHHTFLLDAAAFERCIRQVIQPDHINMLPVEDHYFPPLQEEADRDEADKILQLLNFRDEADEILQLLKSILMEDGPHGLAKFLGDFLYYRMCQDNSEESDVPEDYSDDKESDVPEDYSDDDESDVPQDYSVDEESMDDEQMRTSEVPMEQLTFPHQEHAANDDDVYTVM